MDLHNVAGLSAVKGRKAGPYDPMWKDFQDLLSEKVRCKVCVYV